MPEKTFETLICEDCAFHPEKVSSALDLMPTEREISTLAEAFKIFGDPSRIRIICALMMGELCVCDLSESLGMTQSAVSHQLRLLRSSYLVKTRRAGRSIFYSLDDDHVYSILNQGLAHIRHKTEEEVR